MIKNRCIIFSKLSVVCIAAIMMLMLNGICSAASMATSKVNFFYGDPNLSYTFTNSPSNYSISPGQPWGGVSSSLSGNTLTVVVKCGASLSTANAYFFEQHLSMSGFLGNNECSALSTHTYGDNETCTLPNQLKFAFFGTIIIDGNSYQIVLGQGQSGAYNNWWLSIPGGWMGPNAQGNGICETPDNKYIFSPSGDYGFNIAKVG